MYQAFSKITFSYFAEITTLYQQVTLIHNKLGQDQKYLIGHIFFIFCNKILGHNLHLYSVSNVIQFSRLNLKGHLDTGVPDHLHITKILAHALQLTVCITFTLLACF